MNIKWLFQSKRRFAFLFTSIIAVVVFNLGIAYPANIAGATNATSVISSNAILADNVSSCDPPPSGLVGWWKGDGNAWDSSGYHNNGTVVDEGYTNGIVDEAFEMDPENWPYGTYNAVEIPDAPQYVLTNAFTMEAWIRPRGNGYTIFQRAQVGYYSAYALGMGGDNTLYFSIADDSNNYFAITTALAYNVWWHIAATYSNGVMVLYTNGVVAAQTTTTLVPMGILNPNNSPGVTIGNNLSAENNFPFIGDVDEMSLYNRALSQSEIQAIYNAGSEGKCVTLAAPTITSQPTNQMVYVGQTASFSVTAMSTTPVNFQWQFDGTNILNATNATLMLADVQLNNAGNYAVIVSNELDSVLSSNAVLTVNASSCDPPPSGLVGWWKGDGNAWDSSGYHNNGTVVDEGYTNGIVGEAFEMDPQNWPYGTYNAIDIPDAPQYNLTNAFTIEAWVRPRGDGYTILDRCQAGYYPAYDMTMEGDNILSFNIANSANTQCVITTPLVYNVWTHIAGTYSNGVMVLYTNGMVAAQTTTTLVPMGVLNNNPGLGIGNINDGGDNYPFIGDIDEISLYNRALSQSEIQTIYNAGSGGKCLNLTQPVIISQPTNQTVYVGQTASFSMTAMSTTPVNFQWQFDGTNILDATNASLMLADVQLNNAGVYDVTVTNMIGGVISSNAVLTVSPLDHFAWGSIPSPRFLNVPFPVTIVAQNVTNGTVLNYNNSVILYTTNTIPLSPAFSGNFVQGVWTGAVVVAQTGTNIVLVADDGQGHTGLSNPLNILALPTLSLQAVGPILLLDWPMDYDSFELEESSNLYPANWLPVPVSPLQIGNQYIVPLEMAGTNGFYRLQFQGP